ncbi:terminase small subunit [Planctomycetes bacterium TBK1r]|uniref:Phage DNA packaging protein Nu1 n=1 Tax=Stieleria magnilauensis TaxID=2527963 RepID=A0ABX5XZH8_9BACT|nr:Phage DNA packaging protein Nu1 [Planctomycetes bacterium TBK1r]
MDDCRIASTYQEIAEHFGVSARTVTEWKAKGCPGFEIKGHYDIEAIATWYAVQPKRTDQIEASDLQEALLREDVRKRRAEADIKSHQRDRVVGNLISEEQVSLFCSLWFREASRSMRSISKKVGAGFAPSEFLDQVKNEIDIQMETAIKGLKTKASVLAGQAIEQSDIEQTFGVTIGEATGYEIVLRLDGQEVASC